MNNPIRYIASIRYISFAFVFLLQGSFLKTSAQSDTLSFLHISDIHLIFDVDDYHPELVRLRKHYSKGIKPFQNLLDSASRTSDLRFVAITGDLVDFYGAATASGVERAQQIERFAHLIQQYPVPVMLNLGNHDIVSYGWDGERMTSSQRIAGKARAAWIRSVPAFSEGTYYSRNLTVGATRYKLIFLENGYNSAGALEPSKPPYIDRIQMEWMKEQLSESPDDVEIVLMHIPFGSDAVGKEFYETLAAHSSLKLILSGHEHENRVRMLGSDKKLAQVQSAAFARNANEWRKISLTEGAILVSEPGRETSELVLPVKP